MNNDMDSIKLAQWEQMFHSAATFALKRTKHLTVPLKKVHNSSLVYSYVPKKLDDFMFCNCRGTNGTHRGTTPVTTIVP